MGKRNRSYFSEILNSADKCDEGLEEISYDESSENIQESESETTTQQLLEEPSLQESKTTDPETANGIIVNSLCVKVRKEPNFESEVLEVLGMGEKVKILDKNFKGFYKVSTSISKEAFISSEFIKEE